MVANAKFYNDKRSTLYEDAERVRKTASNWMTRHNPAYRNPGYVAVATPIPEELGQNTLPPAPPPVELSSSSHSSGHANGVEKAAAVQHVDEDGGEEDAEGEIDDEVVEQMAAAGTADSAAADEVEPENEDGYESFKGKTLAQAQEQVVDELIHYTEEEYDCPFPSVS